MYFWINGCPSMQQSGLSSLLFCVPLRTSFHSFSTSAFASGINIAWCERSFIHTARFPEACVSERQISRIVRTIRDSRFPNFFVCTPRIRVYTRDSLSRSTSGVQTSFFPGSHLRASRTPRVVGLPEECCLTDTPRRWTRQHALAFTSK